MSDAAAAAARAPPNGLLPTPARNAPLRRARSVAGRSPASPAPACRRGNSRSSRHARRNRSPPRQRADQRRGRFVSQPARRAPSVFGDGPFTSSGSAAAAMIRRSGSCSISPPIDSPPRRQVGGRRTRPHLSHGRALPPARGRRSPAAPRARAAVQHHQRRDRSDSVHEHGRQLIIANARAEMLFAAPTM